jgi:hypothetical protein
MAPRTHAIWKRVMTVLRRSPGFNGIGHGDNHRRLRGVCATNVSATNGGPPHRRTAANQRNSGALSGVGRGTDGYDASSQRVSAARSLRIRCRRPRRGGQCDSRPSAIKSRDGGGNSPVGEAGCQRPPHTCAALGIPVSDHADQRDPCLTRRDARGPNERTRCVAGAPAHETCAVAWRARRRPSGRRGSPRGDEGGAGPVRSPSRARLDNSPSIRTH